MAQVQELKPTQEKERLTATVAFRLREDERALVEELAQEFDVSLSDAARMLFRRGAKNRPQLVA
jgi:hypothetical protein